MTDEGYDPENPHGDRRARGLLEIDVDWICRQYVNGDIELLEGQFLTPYWIGRFIVEQDALDKQPSTGAVSDVLSRWKRRGYANLRTNPKAFESFTPKGLELGLEKFEVFWKESEKLKKKESLRG